MPRLRSRAALAALGAGLVLPALATLPSQAVVGSGTVSFNDCDVILNPLAENDPVTQNGTWSLPITVDHPSPVPVFSSQTVGFQLGSVPAGTFPEDLTDTSLDIFVEFEDSRGGSLQFSAPTSVLGDFDAGQPLALGEYDVDNVEYGESGRYSFFLKKVTVDILGTAGDTGKNYRYSCDRVANPTSLVTVGVFDPNAPAQITLDSLQATQGQSVGIDGRDFLAQAGTLTPTVGGEAANAFQVDEIGFFDGELVIPEFAPPGQQEVRATYQGETATAFITIVAKKAQLVVTKAVRAGKKLAVSGSQFKPGEKVTLKLKKKGPAPRGTKKAFGSSVTAGPDGTISKAVKLKKAAKGSWKITAKGADSGRTAASGFKVS
ncbi:hypothetical protein GCM10027270_21140 [Nocardioides ginkgobilobae]